MIVVIQIVDIHGDDLSLIETLNVLEYRMAYIDSVHIVTLKHHVERIAWQWRPFLGLQHQTTIPNGTTVAIKELTELRMSLALLALHKEHTADGVVDYRDFQITIIEHLADTGVHKKVATNHLHGITCGKPSAQLGIRTEEVTIRDSQGVGKHLVFRLGITHIASQLHRLVIAQQHRNTTATLGSLSLKFVEEPENLRHIITSVEDVAITTS